MSTPDPAGWRQRVGVLCELPRALRAVDLDPAPVLVDAGLAPDAIDRADQWLPFLSVPDVLNRAIARYGRPDLGVATGRRFVLEHIGLLGEMIRTSPTVGDGIRSYVVHQRLYSQGFAPFLNDYGRETHVGFAVYHPVPVDLAAAHDLLLAALATCLRILRGTDWDPREVHLPRKVPADVTPWRNHFRCKLRFDADRAAMVVPSAFLELPLATADAVRFAELEKQAAQLLDGNLLPLLYRSLRVLLVEGQTSAASLAQQFAMHERTLARRLMAQGTSFQGVLDDVRFEMARNLLHDTSLDITHIAATLGYTETTAFSKAFRRWAGTSPQRWRVQASA